jgi:hypothetical protein
MAPKTAIDVSGIEIPCWILLRNTLASVILTWSTPYPPCGLGFPRSSHAIPGPVSHCRDRRHEARDRLLAFVRRNA